jgi:hypothetical protein
MTVVDNDDGRVYVVVLTNKTLDRMMRDNIAKLSYRWEHEERMYRITIAEESVLEDDGQLELFHIGE